MKDEQNANESNVVRGAATKAISQAIIIIKCFGIMGTASGGKGADYAEMRNLGIRKQTG